MEVTHLSEDDDGLERLRYSVRLLIRHPSLDPDFISRKLGLAPQASHLVGAPRRAPNAASLPGIYRDSVWSCWERVERHRRFFDDVVKILDIPERHASFLAEINETGGQTELIVDLPGDVNIGDTLPSREMRRMAELGIKLGIEVFPQFKRR